MSDTRWLYLYLKMPVQVSVNPTTGALTIIKTFCFYSNFHRGHDKFQLIKSETVWISLLSIEWHSSSLQVYNFQIWNQSIGPLITTTTAAIEWTRKKELLCNNYFSLLYICLPASTHQTRIGVIQPVVQGLPLKQSKEGSMVKFAGISRNKLIHAMFLTTVCICSYKGKTCRAICVNACADLQTQVYRWYISLNI